jgi:predicted amidohydrolase YtcJ
MRIIASVVLVGVGMAGPVLAQDRCVQARDLRLVNGRIHTLDARNSIVTEVTIQDGKFTSVGRPVGNAGNLDPCTRTIDLGGRTVVPGLIDNHNHIVLLGMRPGHDIRIETAASIADVQAMLRAKAATVPRGEFITTLGDWNAKQFAEKRAPTLAELDAALPQHPYIMNGSGTIVYSLA